MKQLKSYKPKRIIDCFKMRPQIHGGFKVVEYSSMSDGTSPKKRTISKDLTMSEAEALIYTLEKKYHV